MVLPREGAKLAAPAGRPPGYPKGKNIRITSRKTKKISTSMWIIGALCYKKKIKIFSKTGPPAAARKAAPPLPGSYNRAQGDGRGPVVKSGQRSGCLKPCPLSSNRSHLYLHSTRLFHGEGPDPDRQNGTSSKFQLVVFQFQLRRQFQIPHRHILSSWCHFIALHEPFKFINILFGRLCRLNRKQII